MNEPVAWRAAWRVEHNKAIAYFHAATREELGCYAPFAEPLCLASDLGFALDALKEIVIVHEAHVAEKPERVGQLMNEYDSRPAPEPPAAVASATMDPWKGGKFWMLEHDQTHEWLMDLDSFAVTRDPVQALRFPSEYVAGWKKMSMPGVSGFRFVPTEHAWIDHQPTAPAPGKVLCTLGVGCDESGVCYADVHGDPSKCGRLSAPARSEAQDAARYRWLRDNPHNRLIYEIYDRPSTIKWAHELDAAIDAQLAGGEPEGG